MTPKVSFHGSDIEKICSCYHLKKENLVNFAANVNPLGLSLRMRREISSHLDLISSYPDREYTSLKTAISDYCHVPPDYILPGNGSSELISLLIEAKAPKHTLILGPTYSEYSRELSFSDSTQEYYYLKETSNFSLDINNFCRTLAQGYDFLILCNPNNPTSSALTSRELRQILTFCQSRNIFVMIDETYIEFTEDIRNFTAVPLTMEFQNLMVLRGISKFFAAPGLRMGYGISGNRDFLDKIRRKQIPWSLNSLGAFASEQMLKDHEYIQETRNLILSERRRLFHVLTQIPAYKVYPANANFFLLKIMKEGLTSFQLFESCAENGLIIRDCSSFQHLNGEFIRFCIMMPGDNDRLLKVLYSMA